MSLMAELPPTSSPHHSRVWIARAYEAAAKKVRDADDVEAHAAFWLLGLLNNAGVISAAYVFDLPCAFNSLQCSALRLRHFSSSRGLRCLVSTAAYVIMLAGANELSTGGAGLVYFWAEFPSILVKATGPYW